MKENPLIFKSEMIRAILEGRKTQTRRIIKPQPIAIYGLTDNHIGVIHSEYENYSRSKVETDPHFTKLGLHGGRRWSDLFENQIRRLWEKGVRGLVCIGRPSKQQGLFTYFVVPSEQEDHEGSIPPGVHVISRDAKSFQSSSEASGWKKGKQCSKESKVGNSKGAVDGCAASRNIPGRGEALGFKAIQQRAGTSSMGCESGAVQSEICGRGAEYVSSLRQLHLPWRKMQKAWVKETFGLIDGQEIVYRATDTTWDEASTKDHPMMIWKPSIFMRRVDSRITLEIEQVRVERLQDISEEDAKAEGCDYPAHGPSRCYRSAFNELWDSISAKKHPWASNPFVWVITFKL